MFKNVDFKFCIKFGTSIVILFLIVLVSLSFIKQVLADEFYEEPEKHLKIIQNKLIDTALQSKNKIRSTSWIDQNGTLHENTRIDSDVTIKGMQVLSYLDQTEEEKTEYNFDSCKSINRHSLKRSFKIDYKVFPNDGRYGYYFINDIKDYIVNYFFENETLNQEFNFSKTMNYTNEYQRALLKTSGEDGMYSLEIFVKNSSSKYVKKVALKKNKNFKDFITLNLRNTNNLSKGFLKAVEMSLVMRNNFNNKIMYKEFKTIFYPINESLSPTPLPNSVKKSLIKILDNWIYDIKSIMSCEPIHFMVDSRQDKEFNINAGKNSGLVVGDRMLLVDFDKIPRRTLESNFVNELILAEIISVKRNSATLKIIAGPENIDIVNPAVMPI